MIRSKIAMLATLLGLMLVMSLLSACSMIGGVPSGQEAEPAIDYPATITAMENEIERLNRPEEEANSAEVTREVAVETEAVPTPVEERLPTEPVPASVPIIYDGWSIVVSQELFINSNYNTWGLQIYLTNLGSNQRVFRFTNSSITATDNLGNVYAPSWRWGLRDTYCEPYHYTVKNLSVDGEDMVHIYANDAPSGRCSYEDGINTFIGPIPIEVEQLYIHFQDFGPFSGVTVVIDL